MLNEFLVIERAVRNAGFPLVLRHPDVKDAGVRPTLHVLLDKHGKVARIEAIPTARLEKEPLWKLSRGQKSSFPFVQPKPLWDTKAIRSWKDRLGKKPTESSKRELLLDIASRTRPIDTKLGEWASSGMMEELQERRKDLIPLESSDARAFPAAIDRFLLACDRERGGNPESLVSEIANLLVDALSRSSTADLLEVAIALFTEGGAFYFDAEGDFPIGITDRRFQEPLCRHLRQIDIERAERQGICAVTGEQGALVTGNFSQPNLPRLGQSFLFSRNQDIPSASRYGRTATDSFAVGYMTDIRLRASIEALTSPEREKITWQGIPGEAPKKADLLLAFVEAALDAPLAESLTEEDLSDASSPMSVRDSIAAFEIRTERLIDLVRAKVNDLNARVQMILLRGVDPGNRKVVYAGSFSVSELHSSAVEWSKGERNTPPVALPVRIKAETRRVTPPHLAPLGLIDFTKQIFLRNGERPPGKKKEQVGLPASEALRVFMTSVDPMNFVEERRVRSVLRLVLSRRSSLLESVAHTQHSPRTWARREKEEKKYDHREALRTLTILGIILFKLQRTKEVYMNDVAFKLGQLLAAADLVHAGYCADVRGGSVPPSLLGNQVFRMAQTSPAKALALLSTRWKPYDGWISRKIKEDYQPPARLVDQNGRLKKEKEIPGKEDKKELRKAWAIKTAMYQRKKASEITPELSGSLPARCDDVFRAELFLGYLAGIPWEHSDDESNSNQPQHS